MIADYNRTKNYYSIDNQNYQLKINKEMEVRQIVDRISKLVCESHGGNSIEWICQQKDCDKDYDKKQLFCKQCPMEDHQDHQGKIYKLKDFIDNYIYDDSVVLSPLQIDIMLQKLTVLENNIQKQDQQLVESQVAVAMDQLRNDVEQKLDKQKDEILEYQDIRNQHLKENQERLTQIDNQASSNNQDKDKFMIDDIETLNTFIDLGLDKQTLQQQEGIFLPIEYFKQQILQSTDCNEFQKQLAIVQKQDNSPSPIQKGFNSVEDINYKEFMKLRSQNYCYLTDKSFKDLQLKETIKMDKTEKVKFCKFVANKFLVVENDKLKTHNFYINSSHDIESKRQLEEVEDIIPSQIQANNYLVLQKKDKDNKQLVYIQDQFLKVSGQDQSLIQKMNCVHVLNSDHVLSGCKNKLVIWKVNNKSISNHKRIKLKDQEDIKVIEKVGPNQFIVGQGNQVLMFSTEKLGGVENKETKEEDMCFYLDYKVGQHDGVVSKVLLMSDLQTLVSLCDQQVKFYDLFSKELIRTVQVDRAEKMVQFDSNGVVVVSASHLKYIGVDGTESCLQIEVKEVKELCVDREGRLVLVDSDANIEFYI